MWQTKFASAVPKNLGLNCWNVVKAISSLGVQSVVPCIICSRMFHKSLKTMRLDKNMNALSERI